MGHPDDKSVEENASFQISGALRKILNIELATKRRGGDQRTAPKRGRQPETQRVVRSQPCDAVAQSLLTSVNVSAAPGRALGAARGPLLAPGLLPPLSPVLQAGHLPCPACPRTSPGLRLSPPQCCGDLAAGPSTSPSPPAVCSPSQITSLPCSNPQQPLLTLRVKPQYQQGLNSSTVIWLPLQPHFPPLTCSKHTALLTTPQIGQSCSHRRLLALVAPSCWNFLPTMLLQFPPSLHSSSVRLLTRCVPHPLLMAVTMFPTP